jgi:hypothetical protein
MRIVYELTHKQCNSIKRPMWAFVVLVNTILKYLQKSKTSNNEDNIEEK